MKHTTIFGAALLLAGLSPSAPVMAWQAPPVKAAADITFPFDLGIVDPASPAKEKRPPYMVVFEDGKDENGKDVTGPLARLEALRGASKLFPESNKDPGLPVVLRGLRFHRLLRADGTLQGYEVELQGEFNSVKVPVSEEEMKKFLGGERVRFSLQGQKNYGVFAYASTVSMDVQLAKTNEIDIFAIEGDFSFREAFTTYTSKTKKLAAPSGRKHLYQGKPTDLPTLPII